MTTLRKIQPPILTKTANGWVRITEAATVTIPALDITVECLVNPGPCSPLLGVGRLAREHDIGYLVEGENHYLLPENGHKLELIVIADVPYIAQAAGQLDSKESSANAARAIAAPSTVEDTSAEAEPEAEADEKLEGPPSPPKAPKVPRPKRREKVKFCTQEHNEFTHFPLDPNCPICQRA